MLGDVYQTVDVEVRPKGVAAFSYFVALVSLLAMERVAVLVREDRDRRVTKLVDGAKSPDRDLAPVRDQHLAHGRAYLARWRRLAGRPGPLLSPAFPSTTPSCGVDPVCEVRARRGTSCRGQGTPIASLRARFDPPGRVRAPCRPAIATMCKSDSQNGSDAGSRFAICIIEIV